MIEVRTRTGTTLRGRSPQSIARRLYGRRAWVAVGSTVNLGIDGYVMANVLMPTASSDPANVVLAQWLLDQAALAAAAADIPAEEAP